MEAIQEILMSGFITITSLIKHALLIELLAMIMVLAVLQRSCARTVFQAKNVGLRKERRFMALKNME